MAGSVYETYYGLNYTALLNSSSPLKEWEVFGYTTTHNRKMIERQQIVTTHNLAALTQALDLDLDGHSLALKVWD